MKKLIIFFNENIISKKYFFLAYPFFLIFIFIIYDKISINFYYVKSLFLFESYIPIIVQICFLYITLYKRKNIFFTLLKFSNLLFAIISLSILVNKFLSIKDIHLEDLVIIVTTYQIFFELYLLLLVLINYKKFKISNLLKIFAMVIFSIFIFFTLYSKNTNFIFFILFIINIFNPVLIYILSLVAKEELLLDDEKN
jgi:hypothetical protein